jgi:hypothetical protein
MRYKKTPDPFVFPKYGSEYVKQSMEEYEARVRAQLERSLQRKAAALGCDLIPKAALNPSST